MSLILYGTEGCHLCDEAEAIIRTVIEQELMLKLVDIVDDDALYEKFELTIPVLENTKTQQQLNWPFNSDDVLNLIKTV